MSANAVRDEKVKVLKSIRWLNAGDDSAEHGARAVHRRARSAASGRGYIEEPDVDPNSSMPTFAAVRLFVDNWRWNGVPFYLRSGKRLKNARVGDRRAVPLAAASDVRRDERRDAAEHARACACSRTKASRSTSR